MAYTNPSVDDFKAFFDRDFPFGTDINTSIRDSDIAKAYTFTNMGPINQDFFGDQSSYNNGYLLLSAHFLVMNIRASSQGLNGQFNWIQTGKGAGSVNESFQVPDWIMQNPQLAVLTKTNYGMMYLQLILPFLVAPGFIAYGSTRP